MGFGKRLSHESASPSSRSVQKTLSLSPEGPVVRLGENVTLVCSSESAFNQFHLLREWDELGRLLAGGWGSHGALQAEFPLGPGTPAHSGVYRCYGSFTRSPYSWSNSSDPLFLSVTGEQPLPGPCFVVPVQTLCCPTLCHPEACSTTDSSVLHYLLHMDHSLVVVKGPSYLSEAMSQSCRATQA